MAHDELPHMDLHCAQMQMFFFFFFFFFGGGGGVKGGHLFPAALHMSDHQGPLLQKLDFHCII